MVLSVRGAVRRGRRAKPRPCPMDVRTGFAQASLAGSPRAKHVHLFKSLSFKKTVVDVTPAPVKVSNVQSQTANAATMGTRSCGKVRAAMDVQFANAWMLNASLVIWKSFVMMPSH